MTQPSADLPTEATDPDGDSGSLPQPGDVERCGICKRVRSALRRWWKAALILGLLLAAIAAGFVWWSYTPEYVATATLEIKEQAPFIVFQERGNSGRFVRTQLELFRTRAILSPSLQDLGGTVPKINKMEDPIAWLQKGIQAGVVGTSDFVSIRFTDPDRETAEKVLEAVIQSYLKYHRRYERSYNQVLVGTLQDEKDRREKTLIELRNRIRDLSKRAGVGEADTSTFFAGLNEELRRVRIDENIAQAELQAFQESADAAVEELRQQLTGDFGEQAALEAKRRYLAEKQELSSKLRSLTARRQVLETAIDEENRRKAESGSSQADLVDLESAKSELERQQEVLNRIGSRIFAIQTEEVAPARVEQIDPPRASEDPVKGLPVWRTMRAGLGGLLLPFVVVMILGMFRHPA